MVITRGQVVSGESEARHHARSCNCVIFPSYTLLLALVTFSHQHAIQFMGNASAATKLLVNMMSLLHMQQYHHLIGMVKYYCIKISRLIADMYVGSSTWNPSGSR